MGARAEQPAEPVLTPEYVMRHTVAELRRLGLSPDPPRTRKVPPTRTASTGPRQSTVRLAQAKSGDAI